MKYNSNTWATAKHINGCKTADGKKGIETPGYWELFAQFYYRETTTPEYCRYYTRPEHALRSFGKMCLKVNGEWEVE